MEAHPPLSVALRSSSASPSVSHTHKSHLLAVPGVSSWMLCGSPSDSQSVLWEQLRICSRPAPSLVWLSDAALSAEPGSSTFITSQPIQGSGCAGDRACSRARLWENIPDLSKYRTRG